MVNRRSMDDIGNFIFVSDEPAPSDLIVIPGTLHRAWALCRRAGELYFSGLAPRILVTGRFSQEFSSFAEEIDAVFGRHPDCEEAVGPVRAGDSRTEADLLRRILVHMGVPENAVLSEDGSVNTFANAYNAFSMLEDTGVPHASLLLCPKPYHARRALMTFQHAFPASRILVCPADIPQLDKNSWLSDRKGYLRVLDEMRKCAAYFSVEGMYEAAVTPLSPRSSHGRAEAPDGAQSPFS